jgi:hypothetical protein
MDYYFEHSWMARRNATLKSSLACFTCDDALWFWKAIVSAPKETDTIATKQDNNAPSIFISISQVR